MVDSNQGNNKVIIKCFLSVLTNQVCVFFKSAFGQGLKIPLSVHPPHLRAQLVVSARGPHLSDQWERVAQSAGNLASNVPLNRCPEAA